MTVLAQSWIALALAVLPDSIAERSSEPRRARYRVGAVVTGEQITSDAIGGRFQLVDTLWVSVTSNVTFDAVAGIYRFRYVVRNAARSMASLERFEIDGFEGTVENLTSPTNWEALGPFRPMDRLVWFAAGETPATWVDDGVSVPPSQYAIQPGDSLTGFAFSSRLPPGQIRYRVRPFEPLRNESEEWIPDLPAHAEGQALGPDSSGQRWGIPK
jgi:hypothetical protein